MAKMFVSYTLRDKAIATCVIDGLKTRGHTVLWDDDLLRIGGDWRAILAQALKECPIVVSILTKNSVAAPYPMSELGAARVLGKVLVPLICDDIDYPNFLQDIFCVRVSESDLDQVLDRVDRDLAQFAANNKKVFIIHGQNEAKKLELKDFLASTLALDPVILHQQNDLGKTIIEKFEYYASQCAFAVALLTPDDHFVPPNSSNTEKWRARQNVIMELGWFMAKLGRERVLILHQGELELPSDINGVIYASFSSSVEEAAETIRKRLRGVGILS